MPFRASTRVSSVRLYEISTESGKSVGTASFAIISVLASVELEADEHGEVQEREKASQRPPWPRWAGLDLSQTDGQGLGTSGRRDSAPIPSKSKREMLLIRLKGSLLKCPGKRSKYG